MDRRRRHPPPHIRPGRFLQRPERPHQQPLSTPPLRGHLQTSHRHGRRRRQPAHAGRNSRAAQRLLPGPQSIRRAGRTNENRTFQRHAPSRKRRRIKLTFTIDHGQKRSITRLERPRRCQNSKRQTSFSRFRNPFGQTTGFEPTLRKHLIQGRNSRGTRLPRQGPAGSSTLQFLSEGRQCGKRGRHSR